MQAIIRERASRAALYLYGVLVALVVSLILAAPSFAQSSPGTEMVSEMQTAVLALLAAGVAVVVAIAIFYAAKSFVNRIRS